MNSQRHQFQRWGMWRPSSGRPSRLQSARCIVGCSRSMADRSGPRSRDQIQAWALWRGWDVCCIFLHWQCRGCFFSSHMRQQGGGLEEVLEHCACPADLLAEVRTKLGKRANHLLSIRSLLLIILCQNTRRTSGIRPERTNSVIDLRSPARWLSNKCNNCWTEEGFSGAKDNLLS